MSAHLAEEIIESGPVRRRPTLRLVATPSFLECVAEVAAEQRERARQRGDDAELIDIAYHSRISQGAISRFENGHSQPRDLDGLLLAYAKVTGMAVADMLREAIVRWEAAQAAGAHTSSASAADEVVQATEGAAQEVGQRRRGRARGGRGQARAAPER